jgi:hypothetical protein
VSLRQKVRLELVDGTEIVVEYDAREFRAWEKANHGESALGQRITVSMLTWLGWHAAKREGSINGAYDTFEKFDAACVDVDGVGDAKPVPTKAARKAAATPKGPGHESSAP